MTSALSVCICTRGRPQDLRAALAALAASTTPLAEVIVSDDGPSDDTRSVAETAPVETHYIVGPSCGLAANRNHALAHVSEPYVLFLDDDCHLAPDFVARAMACLVKHEQRFGTGLVVVSGAERKHDLLVQPADQTFLGFQSKPYDRSVALNSVVINSTVFPTALSKRLQFDSRLRYGSEEVDLATRLVASGATIVYCPEAVNLHLSSPDGRSSYAFEATASRLYATLKRYSITERRPVMAAGFLLVAPLHAVFAGLRNDGYAGAADSLRAVGTAARSMVSFMRERSEADHVDRATPAENRSPS